MRRLLPVALLAFLPSLLFAQPSRPAEEAVGEAAAQPAEERSRRPATATNSFAGEGATQPSEGRARATEGRAGSSFGRQPESRGPSDDDRRERIRQMLERRNAEQAAATADDADRRTIVIAIRNAPASDLAQALTRAMGSRRDLVVVPEVISNSLLVSAPEEGFDETLATMREIVETFDRSPQVLAVDLAIVELGEGGRADRPLEGDLSQVLEDWRENGLKSVERISLTTLENQKTSVQLGSSKSVPSGQSQSFARSAGGVPQRITQYQERQVGTLVQLTARSAGSGVVVDLAVERTKFSDAPPAEGDDDPSPPELTTLSMKSTIRATPGKTVLVGSRGHGDRLVAVLASVRVVEDEGGGEAAAATPGRARRGFAGSGAFRGLRQTKIFRLENADAAKAVAVLKDLLDAHEKLAVTVDVRTNAIIASGDSNTLNTIEALLVRLDEDRPE
jgi:type II secretory pathway component GspD/PulD (secretin)